MPAGGYVNITESDPSPFFMWTGLDCQSMRGDNLVSIHGPPGGSVGIRLDEDGDGVVKCTFTNTHVLFAAIDIKPGGSPNTINVKADKTVPVAILGSASLNIEKVDISPLSTDAPKFGGLTPQAPLKTSYEDVNKDGRTDLVLKYNTAGLGFTSSSTQGCVTGKLIDGTIITGCDSVKIINK